MINQASSVYEKTFEPLEIGLDPLLASCVDWRPHNWPEPWITHAGSHRPSNSDRFILPQKIYPLVLKKKASIIKNPAPCNQKDRNTYLRFMGVGTIIHLFQIHFTSNTGTVDREQSSGASLSNGFVPRGTGAELIHGVAHPAGSEDSPPLARETD
ncbi:hypothetical protein TNCV_3303011 [Trichonephila clavipes]|nr:hypothetical protein TNCV_3303011 [Trichonephila clavipes]